MRVLVTRPAISAGATAAKLIALGHEPLLLPLTQAVHHSDAVKAALEEHDGALAVTSAEALRAMPPESIASRIDRPIFCVGPATAKAAENLGFTDTRTGQGTGLDLAEVVIAAKAGPLLYLAGIPRSPDFERVLAQAGVPFCTVEAYRMVPVGHDAEAIARRLRDERPQAILLYSHETARQLFATVEPAVFQALENLRFLCMSAHVGDAVPDGLGAVALADEPSEKALLALL